MEPKVEITIPNGRTNFSLSFYFSLKEIKESSTEINSLYGYNDLFGCFEALVLIKMRQTANLDNFL